MGMTLPIRPRILRRFVACFFALIALGCGSSDTGTADQKAGACFFLVGTAATCDPTDCVPAEGPASGDCSCKPGYFCAATCATASSCTCPDPIAGCGSSSTCCRTRGVTDAPDPACVELCHATELTCWAPDAEAATSTITASTATGCSGTATLAVNGSVDWTLDCTLRRVCIDDSRYGLGGCLGTRGSCYPADLQPKSFAYSLRACLNGGLSCSVK